MKPPHPANESARIEALLEYDILDTPKERVYEDIVQLAATICGTPIALISLVDRDRQWFKSRVGLPAEQTPRDQSFCAHAICNPDDVLVVPDTLTDPRFKDNPLVRQEPKIRFYAGAPIISHTGHALGTVCVIDRQSRQLTDAQLNALRSLSRQTSALLELRRTSQKLIDSEAKRVAEARLRSVVDNMAVFVGELTTDGIITDVNQFVLDTFILDKQKMLDVPVDQAWSFTHSPRVQDKVRHALARARQGEVVRLDLDMRIREDQIIPVDFMFAPVRDKNNRIVKLVCSGIDITQRKQMECGLRTANERLQGLSKQVLDAQESERTRLSRELHDEIGQALTAIKLTMQSVAARTPDEKLRTQLNTGTGVADQVLSQVRSMSLDLRPLQLDHLGLAAALRWNLSRQAELAGFTAEFEDMHTPRELPEPIMIAAYRIGQEAITNAVRHAKPARIFVRCGIQDDQLHLEVADDGVGFDYNDKSDSNTPASMGLENMRERAELVGGKLEVNSSPGEGTRLVAILPLRVQTEGQIT